MAQLKTLVTIRLVLIAIAILTGGSAIADKPSGGGGKQNKQQGNYEEKSHQGRDKSNFSGGSRHEKHKQNKQQGDYEEKSHQDREQSNFSGGKYFRDQHRTVIHDYYVNEYQTGRCPPGLAKKHNWCMPPGQAKKWAIGRPLPRDVVYYDLPPSIMTNIGPPPAGYRFVRVASDILMINIGTGMVIDAINDFGRY